MWTDQRGSELLPLADCMRLLASAAKQGMAGRLGISTDRAPIIQPVNFALHEHRIVVRLGSGHMARIISGAVVAFEVDHVDRGAHIGWSVLVRGLATPVVETDGDAAAFTLRPLVPVPGHSVFAIRLDVVTGRRFPLPANISHLRRTEEGGLAARLPIYSRSGVLIDKEVGHGVRGHNRGART